MAILKSLGIYILFIGLTSCANQQLPTGGPVDETAPKISTDNSTPNQQTNFRPDEVEIYFNEWVKLEDAYNQIVISPPTEKRPDIFVKGKSIRIKFDKEEVLRENATYTINFGDAVKDITANNILKNYSFVFSTGAFIDSLSIQGNVVNALDGKPMENMTVMLYDNLADSVVYTEKPFYFAQTDKTGNFKIGNIKNGLYKVVAIEDINRNFKFEKGNEKIGFLNDPILIEADSSINLNIRASTNEPELRLIAKKIKERGLVVLGFSASPKAVQLDLGNQRDNTTISYLKDSIYLWYNDFSDSTWTIITSYDTLWADTLIITKDRTNESYSPLKITSAENLNKKELSVGKSIRLNYNRPLKVINKSAINLLDSSLSNVNFNATISDKILSIDYKWEAGINYQLILNQGALTDKFNVRSDSTGYKFKAASIKDFANLNLKINGLNKDQQYIISLDNGNNTIFEESTMVDSVYSKKLSLIKPVKYKLKIVQDINKNGKWDGPNYDTRSQAELISISVIDDLRANWDKDLIINWKEK